MTTFLIVGTSAAGLGAAIKLRQLDQAAAITCLMAEAEMPYNRCLLADLLSHAVPETKVYTRGADFFKDQNITLRLNTRVVALDRAAKQVTCQDGTTIAYDKLLVATGRRLTLPPISGVQLPGVFGFYDLAHVHAIDAWCGQRTVQDAIVIGAGISGIECADALAKRGIRVQLLERAPQVLPLQLDAQGAAFLQNYMVRQGVTAQVGVQVAGIQGAQQVTGVLLADGRVLPAQLVVCATGGKINSDWAVAAGLESSASGALVTDEQMRTSDPDICAAGDVALVKDLVTGQQMPSILWPDAALQGMCAAASMAGEPRPYPGTVQVTSSHVFGITLVTAGAVANPPADCQRIERRGENSSHLYLVRDGRLLGFALVGAVQGVGALRKALQQGTLPEGLW